MNTVTCYDSHYHIWKSGDGESIKNNSFTDKDSFHGNKHTYIVADKRVPKLQFGVQNLRKQKIALMA